MTPTSNLEDLLRALDPLSGELDQENARHRDTVWAQVAVQELPTRSRTRRRRVIGVSSLATVGAAVALIVGLLAGTSPLSAAAATLRRAALADASSAALPSLGAGQYYYQEAQVAMDCLFASGTSPLIRYVSTGTVQSWTSPNAAGQIVITPSAMGQSGSHFATPADEAAWVAAGKPFVPCALASPSNTLIGNPANTETQGSLGGYSATVSGYSAFGVIMGVAKEATPVNENGVPSLLLSGDQNSALSPGVNVANLPSNVFQLATMIAKGEINTDGSVSTTPQVCPVNAMPGAGTGCDTNQQLALIKDLLQLPDASAKFGSVLYRVLAAMPGATVTANATDAFGNSGTSVTVPVEVGTITTGGFEVLIDPTTGTLLSSTDLLRAGFGIESNATGLPADAVISYGPITIAPGLGTLPSTTN
ncbi:MAG TPA: hypothetical protein VND89_04825 [Acidimicrobiales bacterium]|nr:hypothetical protein [Acidimicrobiales bacterium]